MTDIYIQKVTKDSNNVYTTVKEYKIPNLNNFSIDLNTPVSPMPLPEEGADNNMLVKIEGNSATVSLSWTITDESTSPVTVPSGLDVLTGLQQIGYFTNDAGQGSFQPTSIEDNYRIQVKTGATVDYEKLGFFTKFSFSVAGNSPVIWNANISFIVGDVITSFENKVPKKPTGLATSGSPASGEMKLIWTPNTITNGTLSGSVVSYRKVGNSFYTPNFTSTTDPNPGTEFTLTSLSSGTYDVKVASKTSSIGDFTDILEGVVVT
jgi:hypothetical protein